MDNTQAIRDYAQSIEYLRILLAERDSLQHIRQVLITAKEAMERLATTESECAAITKRLEGLSAALAMAQQHHQEQLTALEAAQASRRDELEANLQAARVSLNRESSDLEAKRQTIAKQHQALDEALASKNRELDRLQKECRSWENRLLKAKQDFDAYKASLSHAD